MYVCIIQRMGMIFLFYFAVMRPFLYLPLFCTILLSSIAFAQNDTVLFAKNTLRAVRAKELSNLVSNSINKNLSRPLTNENEEYWIDAFMAIELTTYRSEWVAERIKLAFDSIDKRSIEFQRALLEMAYSNYSKRFASTAERLMRKTTDPKIFALASEYYLAAGTDSNAWNRVVQLFSKRPDKDKHVPFYYGLLTKLIKGYAEKESMSWLISNLKQALPGQTIVISFQRQNRNYPGIAVIRDRNGNFVSGNSTGVFYVQQLARSLSNLPFYLTNGNTPQGIFRMNGFDVSKSMAIGPTTNIQLLMPYETSPQSFFSGFPVSDTTWSEELYKQFIPDPLKEYLPLYESFFASKAGRTEIISHGTTVNPEYYRNHTYYPLTPTQGCLCTKEIWSELDGRRKESDQQRLIDALKKAGGANGYYIVIEIDNKQMPVSFQELQPYLK